jgi:hypothetical protein
LRQKLARSIAGAAFILAVAEGAEAALINVTTTIPGINSGDGKCSLVEAIINSNDIAQTHPDCPAGDGSDTIILPDSSTISLASVYADYQGATALPVITGAITIQGNASAIIRSKKIKTPGRLFAVTASGILRLENVILSGGNQAQGGAIFNKGILTLVDSTITGNKATDGGGIYNAGGGSLEVQYSLVTKNTATFYGAGVFNCGSLIVTNSTISANIAGGLGGGITHLQKMHARYGSSFPRLSGCYGSTGATILNSTIYRNKAAAGGGIANEQGGLVVLNSTISTNTATGSGGGLSNSQYGGTAIENSTITGNIATAKGVGQGGGISNGSFALLDLKHSLISGNKATTGTEINNSVVGTIRSLAVNIVGLDGNAGVDGLIVTDFVPAHGVKLKNILAPLADNGGPTLTHALVPGSPAIDAAPVDSDCPATDQRATARPQGAMCDIGAFEK